MNFGPRFANADNSAILDINGDGKNEILLHSPTGPSQYSTKLFELNYHFPPGDCDLICEQVYNTYYNDWEEVCYPDPNCPPSAVADYGFTMVFNGSLPKHFYVGDFNGDGKTDLINQEGGNSKIRFFTGKGGLFTTKTIPQTGNFVADLNGDGMSDLISFREQDYWDDEILLCDQEYYYPLTPCDGPPPENDDNWPGYCSECWISKITRNFSVTYSPGTDFAYTYTSPIWEIEESSPGSGLSENLLNGTRLHFGDINGDGSIDLFQITENSDNMVFMGSSPEKRLLAAVSNGFDNHTRFEYLPLSVGGDFYSKGSGFMHDDILDIQVPLYAVSRVIVPNGLNGTTTNTTEYSYAGASVHTRGKGFLGFQQATTSQFFGDYDITYINKTILQELDYTFFVPKKVKTEYFEKSIIGTELISETLVENQAEASPFSDHNLVFTNQHLKTISKDFEKHRKTIDAVTLYDEDGNPRKGYTYIGSLNADTESEFVKVVEFDHTYTSGNWSPSWKPTLENRISKKKTTTKTPGQATNIVRETDFMYYDNGALEKVITDPGDPKSVTKTYIYGTGNRLGLLVEEKTSASQLPTVITEYPAYNAHRTFATQTKNNAGQTSYQTYDDVFGKIKTSTGINGLTTSYFYDGFGNLLYKEVPNLVDGSVSFLTTHFSSDWAIGSCDGGLGLYSLETSASWKPNQKTWYDKHGREIQTRTEGAEYSEHVFTETSYDQRGNIITQSRPHFSADPRINQTYYYNSNGTLNESFDQTKIVEYGYHSYEDGTETNGAGFEYFEDMGPGGGIYKGKTIDAAGRVIQSTDNGGELTFKYNAADQLTQVMDEKGIVIQDIGYDLQGDQTYLIDKNSGTTEYFYNAYGQLEYQEDANGNVYEFEYDELGRIKNRISPDGTTHYDYYNSGNGINQLKKEWNDNGESIEYHYDQLGRTTKVIETIDSKIFETEYSYDEFGNLETRIYPSGLVVTRKYDALGYPTKVFSDNINGENILVWEALEMNALGQYTKFKRHNNVITNRVYDQFGMPKEYTTSGIQDLRFDFDTQRGILLSRTDVLNGQYEAFEYDEMDRLTVIKDAQDNLIQRMQYDYNGNLKSHSGAGDYDYLSSRINAVTQIKLSSTSAIDKKDAQEITFTAFHSPRSIKQGKYELNLLYGTDQQRKKTVLSYNEDIESTTYFLPQYEWESKYSSRGKGQNNTTEIHYITAGGELQAMFIKGAASSDGNGLFFTYTDYLGSILTLTDQQGTPVANQSFDAWGRKRDYHDWLSYDDLPDVPRWLIRGYTAHEHLDMFDLINMNGRMYDPTNGRMLSVDNYVQDPYSTQGYNRYSYVLNNPLKYTDPSGEFIFTALALIIPGAQVFLPIAIGADIGAITGGIRGALDPNVGFLEGAAKGAFVGAFSGAMSMIGGGVFLANLAWGIGQGAMAGVMDAAMWGGDMGKSALYGAAIGGLFAAATSGIESIKNARDGYGFGTNEGRLRHYFKKKDIKNLSALLDERYGIDSRLEIAAEAFDEINATRPNGKYVFGAADIENNRILLANEAFDDLNIFKATVVHEYAHLKLDFNELGEFIRDGDGLNGYLNEFRNQGKLKINMRKAYSFLSDVEYRQFVNTIKSSGNLNIFQSMPNRFHQNVLLNNFH
jgi:RHS repeat-associated protein